MDLIPWKENALAGATIGGAMVSVLFHIWPFLPHLASVLVPRTVIAVGHNAPHPEISDLQNAVQGLLDSSQQFISVSTYGAKCDGVTDDTRAIASAKAAAETNGAAIMFAGPGSVCVNTGIQGNIQTGSIMLSRSGGTLYMDGHVKTVKPSPGAPTNFPLGNDIQLEVNGSADIWLRQIALDLTSTTSVGAPGSVTLTVGDTSRLCPPAASCDLHIEPELTNDEVIGPANWSIASATTITATFANTHTQPFTVRQRGALNVRAHYVQMNTDEASDTPVHWRDLNAREIFTLPNDLTGTFPLSALQFGATITGAQSGSKSLHYRNATQSSCFQINNSQDANMGTFCEDTSNNILVRFNGIQGIGAAPLANDGLLSRPSTLTGLNQAGIQASPITSSGATTFGIGVEARADTAASAYTQTGNASFYAQAAIKGAGSTVTNGYGLYVEDVVVGSTKNRAIYTSGNALSEFNGGIITGAAGIATTGVAFANLGTPGNGTILYCNDCDPVAGGLIGVCTSAGAKTGSVAFRLNGAWQCL